MARVCDRCGEASQPLYYLETIAPNIKVQTTYWLCKSCMSDVAINIETMISGYLRGEC